METITKTENKITFKAKVDETLANAIRRSLGQIPVLAIDEVEITRNDSALYDETVAHRIGLIPLKMDKKYKKDFEAELSLVSKKEGFVYSGGLKGDIKPVYETIPITELRNGQEIDIKCFVRFGKGRDHAKYNPGLIFYRNICELPMDKSFLEEVKRICPNATIKEKGDKIIVLDDQNKEVLDVCEGILQRAQKEITTKVNDELIITVESFGQMKPEEIFLKSIDALKKDLEESFKSLK